MEIDEALEAYENIKKNKKVYANIDTDFFLGFADVVLNRLQEFEKQIDLDYVEDNYISKYKIIEKIEELKEKLKFIEKELKENPNLDDSKFYSFDEYYRWKSEVLKESVKIQSKILVLVELLEEE